MTATVFDVAQYILEHTDGPITTIKLQKLVYYCQAWSLVWDDAPLFPERIEAWANGPVAPDLFTAFRGEYYVDPNRKIGHSQNLTGLQKETIDAVLGTYGPKDSQWLVMLTHLEDPWRDARKKAGADAGQKCREEITLASMAEYYSGLL
jgi:uncharacterized phage-associated protein